DPGAFESAAPAALRRAESHPGEVGAPPHGDVRPGDSPPAGAARRAQSHRAGDGAAPARAAELTLRPGVVNAAATDPLPATRSLVARLLDVPRGTPPLLAPRVRRLASASGASPSSPHPGRSTHSALRPPAPTRRAAAPLTLTRGPEAA